MLMTVAAIDRRQNTKAGNPRYKVTFTDGTSANTQTDTAAAYDIQQSDVGKMVIPMEFEDDRS